MTMRDRVRSYPESAIDSDFYSFFLIKKTFIILCIKVINKNRISFLMNYFKYGRWQSSKFLEISIFL
jgi:hypothetical protein